MKTRLLATLWLAAAAALAGGIAGLAITGGLNVESRLTALLPSVEQQPFLRAAMARMGALGQNRLVLLITANEPDTRRRAAGAAAGVLRQSPAFTHVATRVGDLGSADARARARRLIFRHRFHWLAPADQRALAHLAAGADGGARAHFTRRALARLYGPGLGDATRFSRDPLGLARAFAAHAARLAAGALDVAPDGRLRAAGPGGTRYAVVLATSRADPFAASGQSPAMAALGTARRAAQDAGHGVRLTMSGAIIHAAAAAGRARFEASVIGAGSLAGIAILMIWAFGALRPLALSVAVIAGGVALAVLATRLAFGRVHVLTLVFGASLAGVAIDYCLHFFTQRWLSPAPATALRRILPAISLGLVTSVGAYGALAVAPFPGLRQIAVFAAAGLFGGWCGVVALLPAAAGAPPRRGRALALAEAFGRVLAAGAGRRARARLLIGLAVAGLGLAVYSGLALSPSDDLRVLYNPPPELAAADRKVAAVMGTPIAREVLVVRGDSPQAVLARERGLVTDLTAGKRPIADVQAISQLLPPIRVQKRDYARLAQTLYAPDGAVAGLLARAGFSQSQIDRRLADFAGQRGRTLGVAAFVRSAAAGPLRQLWLGRVARRYASLVRVRASHDPAALRQRVAALPDVLRVDRAAVVARLMRHYRVLASWLLAAAYGLAWLLLALRFGARGALAIVAAPLVATTAVTAFFAATGLGFSIFNFMALLLLLGLGADYGIFLRLAGPDNAPALLAVCLSAASTLLAFGLLGLSRTPALHGFGVTLALGLTLTFVLATLISAVAPTRDR